MDRGKVIDAIKNCIGKPKCRDCPWESCEIECERVDMPLDLIQAALDLLEQKPKIGEEQ